MEKSQTLEVRFIKPEDAAAVLEMERAAHRLGGAVPARALDHAGLVRFAERDRSRVYVAAADDRVVGYLLLEADGDECVLTRLTAQPRRRGYGSALLRQAAKAAEKAGCARLVAYAYEEDLAAQQFLKAKGFKGEPVKRAPWDGPGVKFSKSVA